MIPPADRQTLTHRVQSVKHGKPNHLQYNMESDPQGKPMDEWVKEVGKSESRSVMARIRVQDLPGTKVSRLPTGVESREMCASI
jgi:hypothetical protein